MRQLRTRLCETLQLPATEIDHIEQTGHQPVRAVGYDNAARLGERLQPGSQVGRVADDGLLLRRSFADEIADNDQPGRNADAGSERFAARRWKAGGCCGGGHAGANRSFGIVLMRLRPAEIGQHAVAHQLGDSPS